MKTEYLKWKPTISPWDLMVGQGVIDLGQFDYPPKESFLNFINKIWIMWIMNTKLKQFMRFRQAKLGRLSILWIWIFYHDQEMYSIFKIQKLFKAIYVFIVQYFLYKNIPICLLLVARINPGHFSFLTTFGYVYNKEVWYWLRSRSWPFFWKYV